MNSSEINTFNKATGELLDSAEKSYFSYIQRLLKQYRLSHAYNVLDVMNEAYIRGISKIEKGGKIPNPVAWYKCTSLNIIREWRRAQDKAEEPRLDLTQMPITLDIDTLVIEEEVQSLMRAMKALDRTEKQILELRFYEECSWKSISEILTQEGNMPIGENAVRQKGFRAIKKLRGLYE